MARTGIEMILLRVTVVGMGNPQNLFTPRRSCLSGMAPVQLILPGGMATSCEFMRCHSVCESNEGVWGVESLT